LNVFRDWYLNSLLQWYLPGSNAQYSNSIVESDYEFQVYTLDITAYIGSSVQGDASALSIPAKFDAILFIYHRYRMLFLILSSASTTPLFVPVARRVPRPIADPVPRSASLCALGALIVLLMTLVRFPLCPRQYLTDCSEATMDIAKLQKVKSNTSLTGVA